MMAPRNISEDRFDFEGAYITRSPCRDCALADNLPGCSNNCRLLAQVQVLLANIKSCSYQFSECEEYSVLR
jgi:hypothetical protein